MNDIGLIKQHNHEQKFISPEFSVGFSLCFWILTSVFRCLTIYDLFSLFCQTHSLDAKHTVWTTNTQFVLFKLEISTHLRTTSISHLKPLFPTQGRSFGTVIPYASEASLFHHSSSPTYFGEARTY